MKKGLHTTIKIIPFLLASVLILCSCNILEGSVDLNTYETAWKHYEYDGTTIKGDLSKDDAKTIAEMFNGQELYFDNPSCGFTENVSVSFDGKKFCIACDDCPIIKYGSKYFSISETQNRELRKILTENGFHFPCI